MIADKLKGYVHSNCCSSKIKSINIPKKEEPKELNDQDEDDSLEEENTTPKTKGKKKSLKKTDPSEQTIVLKIDPETFQYLGNATKSGFQTLMSYWQQWQAHRHSTFNNHNFNNLKIRKFDG